MTDKNAVKFDAYADKYERLHADNVAITGEDGDYFAGYKVDCLVRAGVKKSDRILDFGCGVGNVTCKLVEQFSDVHGFEPSPLSAEKAKQRASSATVHADWAGVPRGAFSAVVLSCVLHHVPVAERQKVMSDALEALTPGGRLFVFEHNPLNPLTRRAVATCAFDDDAILLWPWEQKKLLRDAGFADVKLDYIVFFPRPLAFLRPLEKRLGWLAAGAQTMTQGSKPLG